MGKAERYNQVFKTVEAVLSPDPYELDDIGKMATIASILKSEFKEWVFCGFYRVIKPGVLEIGPYQGNILACGRIDFSRGVCGKAATEEKTIIVDDVNQFPGYIACDEETVSEIVVPVIKEGRLIAVLDIDSGQIASFDQIDKNSLENIVTFLT